MTREHGATSANEFAGSLKEHQDKLKARREARRRPDGMLPRGRPGKTESERAAEATTLKRRKSRIRQSAGMAPPYLPYIGERRDEQFVRELYEDMCRAMRSRDDRPSAKYRKQKVPIVNGSARNASSSHSICEELRGVAAAAATGSGGEQLRRDARLVVPKDYAADFAEAFLTSPDQGVPRVGREKRVRSIAYTVNWKSCLLQYIRELSASGYVRLTGFQGDDIGHYIDAKGFLHLSAVGPARGSPLCLPGDPAPFDHFPLQLYQVISSTKSGTNCSRRGEACVQVFDDAPAQAAVDLAQLTSGIGEWPSWGGVAGGAHEPTIVIDEAEVDWLFWRWEHEWSHLC